MENNESTSDLSTIIAEARPPGREWSPVLGDELRSVVRAKLDGDAAREDVTTAALRILGQCAAPSELRSRRTGLIVGKVQSGKTLNFTTVIASACDNGYRMVIVLAGTKNMLAKQTRDRLERDLRVEAGPSRPWCIYHNPSASNDLSSIEGKLKLWDTETVLPGTRQTVMVTVHKNRQKISQLRDLLARVDDRRLRSVLVVDDEADQAGLNTQVKKGLESPVYRAILDLRNALPSHTYLQYTATPQGNLLISFLDLLSPDFAEVLQPGNGYVGGKEMFLDTDQLMEIIPPEDLPDDESADASPPPSLHHAMCLFFVGLANWAVAGFPQVDGSNNRSMMVHPSRLRGSHELYAKWVRSRLRVWQQILRNAENPDREAVLEEFRAAHAELAKTAPGLRPFDDLAQHLPVVMDMTEIRVVNSDRSTEIPWHQQHAWLLIGGANLDRGFTVEGLTTTYMPRGPGVGNADTIQQRGRFFGYKSGYLGYCRVFLEQEVGEAFREYVRHEQSIHEWLTRSIREGVSLQDLPRRFLIDPTLRPTRAAILTEDVRRARFKESWFRQHTPLESLSECRSNREIVQAYVRDEQIALRDDEPQTIPDRRTDHQRHQIAVDLDLRIMYQRLLTRLRIPGAQDTDRWLAALYLIECWISEREDAKASLVLMRPGLRTGRRVSKNKIDNPFQGAHPDRHGEIYPGDQAIRANSVTLQLHNLDLYDGSVNNGVLMQDDVPILALWLEDRLCKNDQIIMDRSR